MLPRARSPVQDEVCETARDEARGFTNEDGSRLASALRVRRRVVVHTDSRDRSQDQLSSDARYSGNSPSSRETVRRCKCCEQAWQAPV